MLKFYRLLAATTVATSLTLTGAALAEHHDDTGDQAKADISQTVVNVMTAQGVKIWVPESVFAHKGDVVKLRLINKLDKEHGYSIPAFGVRAVVAPMGAETVTFTANKSGIFPISCQLHPPHVAGQLVVLE